MDFEYTSIIWINEDDLDEMCCRVKKGENFDCVFYSIMSGYEDTDYWASDFILEDVRTEVLARIEAESN